MTPAAGGAVQAVDVLRQQQLDAAGRFQPRQRLVRGAGAGGAHHAPADQAARPVALAGPFIAGEGLEGHGGRALPLALGVAVVGNAAVGAAPRARQHQQARMAVGEGGEGVQVGRHGWA
jgi:hypothetical protein